MSPETTQQSEPVRQHHDLSPSKLGYLAMCPSWINDPNRDSSAADEGTLLHKVCELKDLSLCQTEEQRLLTSMCIDYVETLVRPGDTVLPEEKIAVLDVLYGTSDLILIHTDDSADVVDYKFGRKEVEDSSTNIQGHAYTLGVFLKYPKVKVIRTHFLQPRLGEVSYHQFTRELDMDRLMMGVMRIASRYNLKETKEFVVDANVCLYCGRKTFCPELDRLAGVIARDNAITVKSRIFTPEALAADPKAMVEVLAVIPLIEKWCAHVKATANRMAKEDAVEFPGMRLYSRAGSRSLIDFPGLLKALHDEHGINMDEILPQLSIAVGKVEDMLAAKFRSEPGKHKEKDIAERVEGVLLNYEASGLLGRGQDVVYLAKAAKTPRKPKAPGENDSQAAGTAGATDATAPQSQEQTDAFEANTRRLLGMASPVGTGGAP